MGCAVEGGRVEKVLDDDPANPLAARRSGRSAPRSCPYLDGLSGPPYEIADAFGRAIAAGLAIAGFEIGKTRDLTHPVDLVEENFPYLSAERGS